MASSWPSFTGESYYQWYWLGPVCITMEVADDLEWAQCYYSAMIPMAWGGRNMALPKHWVYPMSSTAWLSRTTGPVWGHRQHPF
jgi:hypothetical protein